MILDVCGKSLKPKQEWDNADNERNEAYARALFSIFNGVCLDEFHRITNEKWYQCPNKLYLY